MRHRTSAARERAALSPATATARRFIWLPCVRIIDHTWADMMLAGYGARGAAHHVLKALARRRAEPEHAQQQVAHVHHSLRARKGKEEELRLRFTVAMPAA